MIVHSKPWITKDDMAATQNALASGFIGQGERAAEFERKMSGWVGGVGGVAVASGAAAIHLALHALSCGVGDEVILPTYVCRSLLQAVQAVGAVPVVCDVGPDWLVEPANVAPLVTPRTKALLLPHLYGMFVQVEAFRVFGVPIIEDCAQAVAAFKAQPMAGDLAVFSFHPTKCLSTGEGGMAVTRDMKHLEQLRMLRDDNAVRGARRVFSPLSDLAAALGISQLARYEEGLRRRQIQASAYAKALAGTKVDFGWFGRRKSMFFRFPLHTRGGFERTSFEMGAAGVTVRRGVDELLHRLLG